MQFNIRFLLLALVYVAISLAYISYLHSTTDWDVFVQWNSNAGEWQKRVFSNVETWTRSALNGIARITLLFVLLILLKHALRNRKPGAA